MKKYLVPFAATFVFLATMSFTIVAKKGAFNGKLKQANDCFQNGDYTSNNCNPLYGDLPVGTAPYNPNSCNYSVPGSGSLFPSSFDVTHTACTGSQSPCCFTVVTSSKTCDLGTCYKVNAIWYNNPLKH
jgi:hypothetical protein